MNRTPFQVHSDNQRNQWKNSRHSSLATLTLNNHIFVHNREITHNHSSPPFDNSDLVYDTEESTSKKFNRSESKLKIHVSTSEIDNSRD